HVELRQCIRGEAFGLGEPGQRLVTVEPLGAVVQTTKRTPPRSVPLLGELGVDVAGIYGRAAGTRTALEEQAVAQPGTHVDVHAIPVFDHRPEVLGPRSVVFGPTALRWV